MEAPLQIAVGQVVPGPGTCLLGVPGCLCPDGVLAGGQTKLGGCKTHNLAMPWLLCPWVTAGQAPWGWVQLLPCCRGLGHLWELRKVQVAEVILHFNSVS